MLMRNINASTQRILQIPLCLLMIEMSIEIKFNVVSNRSCYICNYLCSALSKLVRIMIKAYFGTSFMTLFCKASNPEPELCSNIRGLSSANIRMSIHPKKSKITELSIFILPHLFIVIN